MSIVQIQQGTELLANITVKNADGTPMDLTAVAGGYALWVYAKADRVIGKFSNTLAGYSAITLIDESTGQLQIKLTHAMTKEAVPAKYYTQLRYAPGSDLLGSAEYELCEILAAPQSVKIVSALT